MSDAPFIYNRSVIKNQEPDTPPSPPPFAKLFGMFTVVALVVGLGVTVQQTLTTQDTRSRASYEVLPTPSPTITPMPYYPSY